MKNTTYKIRELCLSRSKGMEGGKEAINMMNAFSNPSENVEDLDLLLANELDNNHPIVQKASFGEERNVHLARIYTYAQRHAKIIPEMVKVVEEVIRERFQSMLSVSNSLPSHTSVIFKGCSGAGKTYALQHFSEKNLKDVLPFKVVQSTDNIKKDIIRRTGNVFSDNQVHLFGMTVFKMLTEVMKDHYPKISSIQEGWFNSEYAIKGFLSVAKKGGLKLDIRDFDGACEAIFLRVLSRRNDPNSPILPFPAIIRGFVTSRECRSLLLKNLREKDDYRFSYVSKNGAIDNKMDPKEVIADKETIDAEIEKTKKTVITQVHVSLFGDSLKDFIGMTIENAFLKAKE